MRIRITFSKAGVMQYVGHLDLHRAWERLFRRSGLPLGYTQGFHPQPRLNLACALPLGFTSQCEIIDAWLESDLSVDHVQACLTNASPPGLVIHAVEIVVPSAPALQTEVTSSVYVITFLDRIYGLDERIERINSTERLPRQRRDKHYDLRPLIEEMTLLSPDENGQDRLRVQLSSRQAATGRPEELLAEMDVKFENTRVHRERLIFG